jgi:phage terminase small subunit
MGLRGPKSTNEIMAIEQARRVNADRFNANPIKPPNHLQPATRQWWEEIAPMLEPFQLHILTAAAESWDRKEQARALLAKHGLSYSDGKGMIRPRPECAIEQKSYASFLRCMHQLRLDVQPPPLTPKNFPNEFERSRW